MYLFVIIILENIFHIIIQIQIQPFELQIKPFTNQTQPSQIYCFHFSIFL